MNRISITMFSNGMSHHQLPFCKYMDERTDVEFCFVATKPVAEERLKMGYEDLNYSENYILRSYENELCYQAAMEKADTSDFVIYGSAPYEFIKRRLKENKWTFLYSERIFKKGMKDRSLLKKIISYFLHFGIVSKKYLGLLCASSFAAKDFSKFGLDPMKMYKWGYFPPDTEKAFENIVIDKKRNQLIWVGRMIDWKHPEMAISICNKLRADGIPFHLTMVGDGELFNEIQRMVKTHSLENYVTLTGSLPKEEVRRRMEASDILLATSDYAEGWGAVINEGMNSGCAVVASHAMGATPFLIQHKENGMIFKSGDSEDLFEKTKTLLMDENLKKEIQEKAFYTIKNEWNGANAGKKLIELCYQLKKGNTDFHYPEGICSLAETSVK